jgi:RHS repeat-associated protein
MIELGTTGNATADYCLVYNYSLGAANPTSCLRPSVAAGNSGNVIGYRYQDNVNSSFSHTATYAYDGVNRLWTAVATGNSTYNLTYSYDRYGNMTCVMNGQTAGPCPQLSYSTATNQLTTSGYTYDGAGNLTKDSSNLSAHTYQWDGEERVSSVDGGPTWGFTYNALGHRAQWGYTGGADQHLFDPEGGWLGVASSYSLVRFGDRALVVYTGSETFFNHVNALGSTSMFTSHSGTAAEDMLFYPWGDVWQSWGSGGYNFANLPYRDLKTTTDLTAARVSSPNLGRWFSADPAGKGAVRLDDPQTWNMYTYVRNNPTTLTDPSGLVTPDPVGGGDPTAPVFDDRGGPPREKQGNTNSPPAGEKPKASQKALDEVAMAAEKKALRLTRAELKHGHRAEYAGFIIKSRHDGSLTFTPPVRGGEGHVDMSTVPVPKGFTVVAEYHTHPYTTREEGEGASPGDVNRLRGLAADEHVDRPGYVGNQLSGAVYRYTQWEPIKSWFDTRTLGTQIGTIPPD